MPKSQILLKIKDLTLLKNGKALTNDLSVGFEIGKIYAIIGPNGAGKSTIANIIMGLSGYRDHSGDIFFLGKSIKELAVSDRAKLGITLAWQEPARFEGLSAQKYLSVSSNKRSSGEISGYLEDVGLTANDYLDRSVDTTLSGGERKRIEIASILAMKPRLAIFDEPDSGIDLETLKKMSKLIGKLKKDGSTVVLITHSETILKLADYAFLVCNGQIIDQGASTEVKRFYRQKCQSCKHKNVPSK